MMRHKHECACGSFFVCRADADQCAITDPYTCPNCLQDQQDDYFNATLNFPASTPQAKDTTHEGKRHLPRQVSQGR